MAVLVVLYRIFQQKILKNVTIYTVYLIRLYKFATANPKILTFCLYKPINILQKDPNAPGPQGLPKQNLPSEQQTVAFFLPNN